MSASPCIDQAFVRRHLQHLAMDDAIPFAGRRGLEGEVLAFRGLEAGRIISQRPINSAVVNVFHTISGVWENTSSTTISRLSATIAAWFMDRSPSGGFGGWRTARARRPRSCSSNRL